MKQFWKKMAIGLAIAIGAALAVCFAVWSFHSLHRFIWFIISAVVCSLVWQYLANPDYIYVEDVEGQMSPKKMSKSRQVGAVAGALVALGIIGTLVWAIGYGAAVVFDLHPEFWEMHLLYGALTVGAVILVLMAIYLTWTYCDDFYHNRYGVRDSAKKFVMWVAIILCGLAAAGAILYFLFPWALRH